MKNVIGLGAFALGLSIIVGGATLAGGARDSSADPVPGAVAPRALFECSNRTIKGTYGIQMQGTRSVPGGSGTEQMIGVTIRTYDGAGEFTQIDNVKGAESGIIFDRPGSGTYVVNSDCTGATRFQPGPGISIEERMVILDYGHEVRSITVSPQSVMTSTVGKRIGWR